MLFIYLKKNWIGPAMAFFIYIKTREMILQYPHSPFLCISFSLIYIYIYIYIYRVINNCIMDLIYRESYWVKWKKIMLKNKYLLKYINTSSICRSYLIFNPIMVLVLTTSAFLYWYFQSNYHICTYICVDKFIDLSLIYVIIPHSRGNISCWRVRYHVIYRSFPWDFSGIKLMQPEDRWRQKSIKVSDILRQDRFYQIRSRIKDLWISIIWLYFQLSSAAFYSIRLKIWRH